MGESLGDFIDGVERVAMQQFFPVARTQTCEIEFVHESPVECFQSDPGGESVFGQRDGFHAGLVLFDFWSAVAAVIRMSKRRDHIRVR